MQRCYVQRLETCQRSPGGLGCTLERDLRRRLALTVVEPRRTEAPGAQEQWVRQLTERNCWKDLLPAEEHEHCAKEQNHEQGKSYADD